MYYLVTIQNDSIPAIAAYSTLNDASAAFHQELAYRGEGRTSTSCLLFDSELRRLNAETYTTATPEPQEG